ncbi:hypothetical protein NBRC116602_17170 [Hyphomicrobiales bacterium 4NK60-0047b]
MQEIYRVCGDRLNNYTAKDGWPNETLAAFDNQILIKKIVMDDIKFAFMNSLLPKAPSRFTNGNWSVLYAAKDPITAIYEVAHHFRKEFFEKENQVTYRKTSKIVYKIKAKFINQKEVPDEKCYHHPDDYSACQTFAEQAKDNKHCSLKAKSVRYNGGISYPIFIDSILEISPSLEHRFQLRWYCEEDRLTHFVNKKEEEIALKT